MMKALDHSHYEKIASFVSLQAYYTIAGRDLEREIVPMLQDQKVGLMVWSPLAGGFLSGKFQREGKGVEGTRRTSFDFPPVDKDRAYDILDVLRPMAEAKKASIPQLALAWLLHQSVVTSVIIGANKMEQLEDNLKSVDVVFTAEELKQLDDVSKLPAEYPGWMLAFTGYDRQVEWPKERSF
jgi:aryl-alcohol dehydrogenase-like predicted oxidoreductase